MALDPEQAVTLDLPRNLIDPAKKNDYATDYVKSFGYSMTRAEIASGGVQIEIDAVDLPDLRRVYADAIDLYWDWDEFDDVFAQEQKDIAMLEGIAADVQAGLYIDDEREIDGDDDDD